MARVSVWHYFIALLLASVTLAGVFWLLPALYDLSSNSVAEPQPTESDSHFVRIYRTGSNIFLCQYLLYTESPCHLFTSDLAGQRVTDMNVAVDTPEKGILMSPDGRHLLIVLEHEAMLLNTNSIQTTVLFETPPGEALGTYTSFPNFVPHARWLNDSEVELYLYVQDTPNGYSYINQRGEAAAVPTANPIGTKIFKIK
jgi:hypothetical protein